MDFQSANSNNAASANINATIITSYPRPNEVCYSCDENGADTANIRFLNAAAGYNPFVVFVNENTFSSGLCFGELTDSEKTPTGRLVVTLMGSNGYIYLQKEITISKAMPFTAAIINTESGVDLELIQDKCCDRGKNTSCIRIANLCLNSGTLNVIIGDQYMSFKDLHYKSVTNSEPIWGGEYKCRVMRNVVARYQGFGSKVLLELPLSIHTNKNYTLYLFSWKRESQDAIKAVLIEDN